MESIKIEMYEFFFEGSYLQVTSIELSITVELKISKQNEIQRVFSEVFFTSIYVNFRFDDNVEIKEILSFCSLFLHDSC